MEFRLTYSGPLLASSNRNPRAEHKQQLRKHFHSQLRKLWSEMPSLHQMFLPFPFQVIVVEAPSTESRMDRLASQFQRVGYRFVPLVTAELALSCKIDILYLRREAPGRIVQSGDIDNRVKTLFDAFKMPKQEADLGGYLEPSADEDPFFCLVEDDSLITGLTVETDRMLEGVGVRPSDSDARLTITVTLRPARMTWENMGFV